ncbi:MAG: class I SAM-dependent methyltransferase [Anaerolineales bacterium]|nr:class I SAM-dependent methyltransferase [Anaerolineales bacterium]
MTTTADALPTRLAAALAARAPRLAEDPAHTGGWRLFNGFVEGWPELTAEVYARTLVLHNYARPASAGQPALALAQAFYLAQLPWLAGVFAKARAGTTEAERRGQVVWGAAPDTRLREAGVRYALDLGLNQDTGFYLDTRALRAWAREHLAGQAVLNAFAYTGSLGVAALAGGAARVVQLDRSRAFLNVAKASYTLNGFPIRAADFLATDFFSAVARLRRAEARFDCVLLDPPFFSATAGGRVDLVAESGRLINKIRPLAADGGRLVAVNNALFVSGADYLRVLEALCADGYLSIEALIPAPPDCAGYPETTVRALPADPAPFNHATKIAVLRVRRKAP